MDFAIADMHFWHKNIIKYDNRPFKDVEQMNETMIASWNKAVSDDDTVYHIGDFTLTMSQSKFWEVFSRLKGKIVFIRGNHDQILEKVFPGEMVDVKMVKGNDKNFWLSHYQHAEWPDKHRGVLHLFGHSHGRQTHNFVGAFDMCANSIGYTPMSLNAIAKKAEEIWLGEDA